jgi:uncharacterized membrane protein (DUF373 family)
LIGNLFKSILYSFLGLLVFYEIFKYLEEALERHKDSLIGDLLITGIFQDFFLFYIDNNHETI